MSRLIVVALRLRLSFSSTDFNLPSLSRINRNTQTERSAIENGEENNNVNSLQKKIKKVVCHENMFESLIDEKEIEKQYRFRSPLC